MFGVNAAAEGSQRRTAVVLRMRREMQLCSLKRKGRRNLFLTDGSNQKGRTERT